MTLFHLFVGFFIANMLGYGGGPSSIPLMYDEIVKRYHWLENSEFSNMLALGNALPGPIATKIAAFVGYDEYGFLGVAVALAATIIPTVVLMILLLNVLNKHRQSIVVKGMTLLIQPILAIMMLVITWQMAKESIHSIGAWQFLGIAAIAFFAMRFKKVHPAFVILAAFIYGGIVLQHFV
ncbi:chromate transporter [Rummeliibacillus sp. JY-2-4R]